MTWVRSNAHRPGYKFAVPMEGEEVIGKWAHSVKDDEVGGNEAALCGIAPGGRWVRRAPLGVHRCPACTSLFNQLIGAAGGKVGGSIKTLQTEPRPLRVVAQEIMDLWPAPRRRCEPYLQVMANVDLLEETHNGMTGLQAVEEFLARHGRVWRGKQTHPYKRELSALARLGRRRMKHEGS